MLKQEKELKRAFRSPMFSGMKKRLLQRRELTATSVVAPATSAMKMRRHRCEIDYEAPEINLLKK
jgi:hypothetical protein